MQKKTLNNNVEMPVIMMGTSICDQKGSFRTLHRKMADMLSYAVQHGVIGIDTARDYSNEAMLGNIFKDLIHSHVVKREDLFITTKVGNGQQRVGNMDEQISISLKSLNIDYVDLWLLHWPLPDYYIDNWNQLCKIYKSGKVRAIGIANCRERHIVELEKAGVEMMPHVIQVEYHPFRTIPKMRDMCNERNIQLEAYSSNCLMLPFVRDNPTLINIAEKYCKSVTQVIMRWHVQQGVIPIFSSMNPTHIQSNIDVFDFELSEKDMDAIFALNIDYKFHPESLNCPGF